jgi:hypothetical protein
MEVLHPKVLAPETAPSIKDIAAARTAGTVYGSGIKELEELWANGSGPIYLKSARVSQRAIRTLGAFELGHRITSFRTSKWGNTPIVISDDELDAFLEGFCEVLPGPYPVELSKVSEDALVAKHEIFHNQSAAIRRNHWELVRFLEQQITDTLSHNARHYTRELTLFEFAVPDTIQSLKAYV